MTAPGLVELEQDGPVWILRMQAGENRFNRAWLDQVSSALDLVEASEGPRALVTTGAGKFYSNGLDLDWLAGVPGEAGGFVSDLHGLLGRVLGFPAVTIAAVNGHAFAAGAMLATAHDIVIMRADRGYWCLPEADLGLPLTPAMFAVLRAKLPGRAAQEAILTGRRYGGPDAVAAGLAHQAAAEDDLLADAIGLAASLAGKDRRTLAEHKRLLYGDAIDICRG